MLGRKANSMMQKKTYHGLALASSDYFLSLPPTASFKILLVRAHPRGRGEARSCQGRADGHRCEDRRGRWPTCKGDACPSCLAGCWQPVFRMDPMYHSRTEVEHVEI